MLIYSYFVSMPLFHCSSFIKLSGSIAANFTVSFEDLGYLGPGPSALLSVTGCDTSPVGHKGSRIRSNRAEVTASPC
jgi:hypothetical protein